MSCAMPPHATAVACVACLPPEVWRHIASYCTLPDCAVLSSVPAAYSSAQWQIKMIESSLAHISAKASAVVAPWEQMQRSRIPALNELVPALIVQLHRSVIQHAYGAGLS